MMVWYTIGINVVTYIKPKHLFYILSLIIIISSALLILQLNRPIFEYINDYRFHAEDEEFSINSINIAFSYLALLSTLVVLKMNILNLKYGTTLLFSLFCIVGFLLLIFGSKSAILFYIILAIYTSVKRNNMRLKTMMVIAVLITLLFVFSQYKITDEIFIFDRLWNYNWSSSERINATLSSISIFFNNPLFGVGLSEFSLIQEKCCVEDHNFYTNLLGKNGLIGLFFVLIFFYSITKYYSNKIHGIILLKLFFFYNFIIISAASSPIFIAVMIYYLSELIETNNHSSAKS